MRTVWDIPNNKTAEELMFGKHPTQKPVRLLRRMLSLSAKPGDVLLVPFAGSGADCVAAQELGINFLGFETDSEFITITEKRLEHAAAQKKEFPGLFEGEHKKKVMSVAEEQSQLKANLGLTLQYRTFSVTKKQPMLFNEEDTPETPLGTTHRARSNGNIPSLIKWTGSKRSQANAIAAEIGSYRRYFEPFVGGGGVLFLAAQPHSVAGDLYKPLIDLWKLVQDNPDAVIRNYEKQWQKLYHELESIADSEREKGNGFPQYYYKVRDRFNATNDPLDLSVLMRTCVNGIVRFNEKGEFNNSFHLSRKGMEPPRFAEAVCKWNDVIRGVRFVCQDYEATVSEADQDDFVYFDPPYAGNCQRYIEN